MLPSPGCDGVRLRPAPGGGTTKEDDGGKVPAVVPRYQGPVAILGELYVRPGLRSRRLGSALLAAGCGLVRERGGELLEINVNSEDLEARRFYEARGFSNTEPNGTEPMLYDNHEL